MANTCYYQKFTCYWYLLVSGNHIEYCAKGKSNQRRNFGTILVSYYRKFIKQQQPDFYISSSYYEQLIHIQILVEDGYRFTIRFYRSCHII